MYLDPQSLMRLATMVMIPLVLAAIPYRFEASSLMRLAFAIWMTGGLMLSFRGVHFLQESHASVMILSLSVVGALVLGMLKGKFILNKSSIRNILRLQALESPQKAIHVYPLRSWIVIGVMLLISIGLNIFQVNPFTRGLINLGVGMGLITSSFIYLKYLKSPFTPPVAEDDLDEGRVHDDTP
ncbi:MAG: hypothetical protein HEQ32_04250 [Vampirovibrio sp.]